MLFSQSSIHICIQECLPSIFSITCTATLDCALIGLMQMHKVGQCWLLAGSSGASNMSALVSLIGIIRPWWPRPLPFSHTLIHTWQRYWSSPSCQQWTWPWSMSCVHRGPPCGSAGPGQRSTAEQHLWTGLQSKSLSEHPAPPQGGSRRGNHTGRDPGVFRVRQL